MTVVRWLDSDLDIVDGKAEKLMQIGDQCQLDFVMEMRSFALEYAQFILVKLGQKKWSKDHFILDEWIDSKLNDNLQLQTLAKSPKCLSNMKILYHSCFNFSQCDDI